MRPETTRFDRKEKVMMCAKRVLKKASASRPDLKELFEEFIKEKEALNKADATLQSYQITFDRFYAFLKDSEEFTTNC